MAEVASLQAQVEALTPDMNDPDDLETQLFKARSELEKQRANVETLKEQLTRDQRQVQALTRENALLRIESASQVKDPDAAYQDLLKEANELFAQVDAQNKQIDVLRDEIVEKDNGIRSLNNRVTSLEEGKASAEQKSKNYARQANELSEKNTALTNELDAMKQAEAALRSQLEETAGRLIQTEAQAEALTRERDQLKNDLAAGEKASPAPEDGQTVETAAAETPMPDGN